MTSREQLAWAVVAAPAVVAVLVAARAAPGRADARDRRRVRDGRARARARRPRAEIAQRSSRGNVDRRRCRRRPAHLRRRGRRTRHRPRLAGVSRGHRPFARLRSAGGRRRTSACSTRSGPFSWRCRSPATSAGPGCSSRRRLPPRRCSSASAARRGRSRRRGSTSSSRRSASASRCSGSSCSSQASPAAGSMRLRGRHSRRTRPGAARRSSLTCSCSRGLAAKIGWAPVHNWLPDAHSEAPPPVSALLSAALLPAVLLVAWRSEHSLAPVIGVRAAQNVLIFFGLVSLAVAIPFLWRSLPWKRLLAYSSLEHMGVIALGIGFGTPLALAGVAVHIAAHAVAKALGFLRRDAAHRARASRHRSCRHRYCAHLSGARRRHGHLARSAGRPPAVAALLQRGAHRRRRLPGRTLVGRRGGGAPARARLPRARARAARDDGRQGAAARRHAPPRRVARLPCSAASRSRCCSGSPPSRSGCPGPRSSTRCSRGIS